MSDQTVKIIENATLDDVRPGDHVTWEASVTNRGVSHTTRLAGIVHHRDAFGNWRTKDGDCITMGHGGSITITIRRTIPTLPTKNGAVIEANDGCEFIEAEFYGVTFYAREAVLINGKWRAAWRTESGNWTPGLYPERITTDTWKKSNG